MFTLTVMQYLVLVLAAYATTLGVVVLLTHGRLQALRALEWDRFVEDKTAVVEYVQTVKSQAPKTKGKPTKTPRTGRPKGTFKLTDEQIEAISCKLLLTDTTQREIASDYGVSERTISRIWNRSAETKGK